MDAPRPTARATIGYLTDLDGVTAAQLRGFFDGWPHPPTPETHLRILVALGDLYMVDVTCDAEALPFYRALGLRPATGASVRRYALQSGAPLG